MLKPYDKIKIEKKDGIATIEGEITLEAIEEEKIEALRNITANFKAPGFRPGKVPEAIIKEHISEQELFEDGAQEALKLAYPEILEDYDIRPLTYPRVEVKKFELGKPVEFTIRVGVIPEFKLPNYKALAKDVPLETPKVEDAEVEKFIKDIEEARSTKEKPFTLTDETAKTLGKFENALDLKNKLKENLTLEKTEAAKAKRREALSRLLIEKTRLELPKFWEEDERHAILHELEEHAESHKIPKEKLLEGFGKTGEQYISDELAHRAKREKIKTILERIAEEKKITPTEEEIEREAMNLRTYYDETDHEKLKEVARTGLLRQKALEFIEELK